MEILINTNQGIKLKVYPSGNPCYLEVDVSGRVFALTSKESIELSDALSLVGKSIKHIKHKEGE